ESPGTAGMIIALVDCNGFYAACEEVFRPDLARRPVVVLSNNDGCIVAMNRRAKNLGIPRGIPYFKARFTLEKEGAAVFSSNYALYADMSKRVMSLMSGRVPAIEPYSIDEAFLSLDHLPEPPLDVCRSLRGEIRRGVGIPTSIGVAPTKVLAKIAGGIAKKRADGIFSMGGVGPVGGDFAHVEDIDSILAETPVEKVWGVASGLANRLTSRGITTALGLKNVDDAWAKDRLTLTGLRIVWELRGIPSIAMEETLPPKKGIMSSKSFGRPVTDLNDLLEAVGDYTARAAAKLRAQGSVCRLVDVWLTTNRFKDGEKQHSAGTVVRLEEATDYLPDLVSAARRGLRSLFRDGYRYKKAAVFLSGIEDKHGRQSDLFRTRNPRKTALMSAVDEMTSKYGPGSVCCTPLRQDSSWAMRREQLSPCYTTQWRDVPSAKMG
ncbi:MAG: Y-family DNA polymerase, partial [Spirochaetaceae bacterium]|nr:Y-family DNA polymerase [Spirochaetaceae bacterium]